MGQKPEEWQVYVYGTVAVLLISGASFIGALTIPFMQKHGFKQAMIFFMSLAIGTMAADALLHLVPQTIGLEKSYGNTLVLLEADESVQSLNGSVLATGDTASSNHRYSQSEYYSVLYKLLVSLFAVYMLYLFESLAKLYTNLRGSKGYSFGHGHGHMPPSPPLATNKPPNGVRPTIIHLNDNQKKQHLDTQATHVTGSNSSMELVNGNLPGEGDQVLTFVLENGDEVHSISSLKRRASVALSEAIELGDDTKRIWGMKPVVFMIIIGGALHNFADGLALGASFAASLSLGLSTTVALICHEIPHELGDFAVLINTGLSVKKALLLNGLSAVPAIVGLYVAIGLSLLEGVLPWIFAVVLGTFIYISLVAMLNELREVEPEKTLKGFVLSNSGLILGAVILVLIAFYEDMI